MQDMFTQSSMHILLILVCFAINGSIQLESDDEIIHRKCNHKSIFSEQEIDSAMKYIQNRFISGATVKPIKSACSKLRVRHDFKCLSHEERIAVTNVFQELYKNGVMDKFAQIHGSFWPLTHKLPQGLIWHRWFVNEFEKEFMKINSSLTLPYWETESEFAALHKSIIWDYFGRAGNETNNYTIPDGPFKSQTVSHPQTHYVKREWNVDGTIPPTAPPEWMNAIFQMSATDSLSLLRFWVLDSHFKFHLSIGGWNGDMSVPYATNDPIFYLYHNYLLEVPALLWQLSDDQNLVPHDYVNFKTYNMTTRTVSSKMTNSTNDYLVYWDKVSTAETFQMGFGELCSITDHIVILLNEVINGKFVTQLESVERLRKALPQNLFASYFPDFAANNTNPFHYYTLPQLGTQSAKLCRKLPISPPFNSTDNGLRQLNAFKSDSILPKWDIAHSFALDGEKKYLNFINDLNRYGYCSDYV